VPCYGNLGGSAAAVVFGGTSPYTYLWSDGNTSSADSPLSAGSYTVTLTDANSATATGSVTITQPSAIAVSITAVTDATCSGGSNGSASVSVSGGTSPYTYLWSNGQTNATATGLSPGTYNVMVTDANDCNGPPTIININALSSLSITPNVVNVSCSGSSTGIGNATVTGGIPPYTYQWNPGYILSPTATGLSAGTYSLSVTDALGCEASTTVSVTQPIALSATTLIRGNLAGILAAGGTPPYSYSWAPGGGTSDFATGLNPGTYTVTIYDNNACLDSTVFTILNSTCTNVILTLSNNSVRCGDLYYYFDVLASASDLTVFNGCTFELYFPDGELKTDYLSGGINITAGSNFQPDTGNHYDMIDTSIIGDSILRIKFGMDTVSRCATILSTTPQVLFHIGIEPTDCEYGNVSFIDTLNTAWSGSYTDSSQATSSSDWSFVTHLYCSPTIYQQGNLIPLACPPIYDIFWNTNYAGLDFVMNVYGNNFGNTGGPGQFFFTNADTANTWIRGLNAVDLVSWTNNEIQVRIPGFVDSTSSPLTTPHTVGGPRFMIINSCGDSATHGINIIYNINQAWNAALHNNQKYEVLLRNIDSNGGYVFRLDSNTFPRTGPNAIRRLCFAKAMRDWICATGVNLSIGKDTTIIGYNINMVTNTNYVAFDSAIFLHLSGAAETKPWLLHCDSMVVMGEGDIMFNSMKSNNGPNFVYDTNYAPVDSIPKGEVDFYGTCLHELGHFIQIGHNSVDTDLMYYQANNGYIPANQRKRLFDTSPWVSGGIHSVNQSVSTPKSRYCNNIPPMTPGTSQYCTYINGIEHLPENSTFAIYPNPSSGTFTIVSKENEYTLIITNILGQRILIQKIQTEDEKTEIDLSSQPSGMYFIQLQYNNSVATQKLIITHK
jgi:hypothetical protein